jgi:hypothetical protein
MTLPMDNHQAHSGEEACLLDQLVDGELPEVERRKLLLRLDTEPDGWRRCALAFLEAQSWREALGPLTTRTRPKATSDRQGRKPRSWSPVARLAELAAAVVAAFALGWVSRGQPAKIAPNASVAEEVVSSSQASQHVPDERVIGEPRLPQPTERLTPPDPVVKQLEQHGYRTETQTRVVSMHLKDGRKVDVPVREVRFRYIGDRTY